MSRNQILGAGMCLLGTATIAYLILLPSHRSESVLFMAIASVFGFSLIATGFVMLFRLVPEKPTAGERLASQEAQDQNSRILQKYLNKLLGSGMFRSMGYPQRDGILWMNGKLEFNLGEITHYCVVRTGPIAPQQLVELKDNSQLLEPSIKAFLHHMRKNLQELMKSGRLYIGKWGGRYTKFYLVVIIGTEQVDGTITTLAIEMHTTDDNLKKLVL